MSPVRPKLPDPVFYCVLDNISCRSTYGLILKKQNGGLTG